MFPIKNRQELEELEELVLFENQVEELLLQDKLGKQNFFEDTKKVFEPMADTNEVLAENISKTITETSITKNKAIENLNEKVLELMKDNGTLAPFLASSGYYFYT